jgi:hypothetical protein
VFDNSFSGSSREVGGGCKVSCGDGNGGNRFILMFHIYELNVVVDYAM